MTSSYKKDVYDALLTVQWVEEKVELTNIDGNSQTSICSFYHLQ